MYASRIMLVPLLLVFHISASGVQRDSVRSYLKDLGIDQKNLPLCSFDSVNTCQGKGSGGHAATIFSTSDGFCAKKIRSKHNVKEIEFYQDFSGTCNINPEIYNGLCEFVPRYGGVCQLDGHIYVKMQNLKINPKAGKKIMRDPRALDLKIGKYTASKMSMQRSHETALAMIFWMVIHVVQDRYLTSSDERGYRYAGLSVGDMKNYKGPGFLEKTLIMLNPERILRQFTPGARQFDSLACFVDKLGTLNSVLGGSFFDRFHLIGASALLVYDFKETGDRSKNCQIFLIDFANSFIIHEGQSQLSGIAKNKSFVAGFRKGIFSLQNDYIHSTK